MVKRIFRQVFDWMSGTEKSSLFRKFSDEDQLVREKQGIDKDSSSATRKLIEKLNNNIEDLKHKHNEAWAVQDTHAMKEIDEMSTHTGKLLAYAKEHLPEAEAEEKKAREDQEKNDKQLAYEKLQRDYERSKFDSSTADEQFHMLKGKEGALVQNLIDSMKDSDPDFAPKTPDEALKLVKNSWDIDKKASVLKVIIDWQDLLTQIKEKAPAVSPNQKKTTHTQTVGATTPQANPPEFTSAVQALNHAATQLQGMPGMKTLQQQLNSTLTLVNKAVTLAETDNTQSQKIGRDLKSLQEKVRTLEGHMNYNRRY